MPRDSPLQKMDDVCLRICTCNTSADDSEGFEGKSPFPFLPSNMRARLSVRSQVRVVLHGIFADRERFNIIVSVAAEEV